MISSKNKQIRFEARRGGILVLIVFLLPVLFILGSFAINVAYIQLTRTELMVATDASARAGSRGLSFYQNVETARDAALVTAGLNDVAGRALRLQLEDDENEISFGDSEPSQETDRYDFSKVPITEITNGSEVINAIRVTGKLDDDSDTGALDAIFPTFGMRSKFDLQTKAVAMQVDRDIALILDRSGSMGLRTYEWPSGFDPWSSSSIDVGIDAGILDSSGTEYTAGNDQTTYQDYLYTEHLQLGDVPNSSWEDLVSAVDVFLTVLEGTQQSEKVSLATYESTATLDLELVSNYETVRTTLSNFEPNGGTAIGDGLSTGLPTLMNVATARPFASKTIVLMTDGMHNTGDDPVTVTTTLMAQYKVTIHTVTFGGSADQERMIQVAAIGGGQHYHAADGAELIQKFEEIANNLPTLISK